MPVLYTGSKSARTHTGVQGGSNATPFTVATMQAYRPYMEDAYTAIVSLKPFGRLEDSTEKYPAFFAVYDGHGGDNVAIRAARELHIMLSESPQFESKDYTEALRRTFLDFDSRMRKDKEIVDSGGGSTSVVVLIDQSGTIYCANAGDSRAIVSVGGRQVPISIDHKPNMPRELSRIIEAAGYVDADRVDGMLAVSRAFGDFDYKTNSNVSLEQQKVTANPELYIHLPYARNDFVMLMSDGVTDRLESQDIVDFVGRCIAEGRDLKETCEEIVRGLIRGKFLVFHQRIASSQLVHCAQLFPGDFGGGKGTDNMTIILVPLLQGRSLSQWSEHVGQAYRAFLTDKDRENRDHSKSAKITVDSSGYFLVETSRGVATCQTDDNGVTAAPQQAQQSTDLRSQMDSVTELFKSLSLNTSFAGDLAVRAESDRTERMVFSSNVTMNVIKLALLRYMKTVGSVQDFDLTMAPTALMVVAGKLKCEEQDGKDRLLNRKGIKRARDEIQTDSGGESSEFKPLEKRGKQSKPTKGRQSNILMPTSPTVFARFLRPSPTLDHTVRLLSTVSGTDKVLMTVIYASKLVAFFVHRNPSLARNARALDVLRSLENLSAPLSDVRYVLRYYGLLPMIQYSVYLENNPPSNRRLLHLGRLQNICMFLYFPLEHAAWLGQKGVIKMDEVSEEYRVLRARQRQLAGRKSEGGPEEVERVRARLRGDIGAWQLNFAINACFLPMVLHWSRPEWNLLTDAQVGAFGTGAAVLQLWKAWGSTA
ncbi:Protein phosphatase 2C 2 [Gonapodya sp. JEL0774]|nr:Protein phosphatase 2C 2 [Gonapodya sp. JEL0774]